MVRVAELPSGRQRRRLPRRSERRAHVFLVRCDSSERAALEVRAKMRGVSVARLLLDSALVRPAGVSSVDTTDLAETLGVLQRQVVGIATNINQLARAANQGRFPPAPQLEAVMVAAKRSLVRLEKVALVVGQ